MKRFKKHECELYSRKGHKYFNKYKHWYVKIFEMIVKFRSLWEHHYRVRIIFRSRAAIENEKKRHMKSKYKYVIHPFSKLCLTRSVINTTLWLILFFHDLWLVSYDQGRLVYYRRFAFWYATINIYFLCDCVLNFISGYISTKTREVIIEPKLIIKRYLTTYFFFDFISSIPYLMIVSAMNLNNRKIISILEWLHVLRSARIISVLTSARDCLNFFDLRNIYFLIATTVFIVIYQLNFFVCLLYYLPETLREDLNYDKIWLDYSEARLIKTPLATYVGTLLITMNCYLRIGKGNSYFTNELEYGLVIVIFVCGFITDCSIVAFFMTRISASNASEAVYQQLIAQAKPFVNTNRLFNYEIDALLRSYYTAVYGGKYFDTNNIFRTFSRTIQKELMLHECRLIFDHMKIFNDLPKDIIELILLKTKKEYYLTGDVIMTHLHELENVFLISYGTIAVYHKFGVELCHYYDGDIIGESAVIDNRKCDKIYIACETCEVLLVDLASVKEILQKSPLLKDRFVQSALAKERRLKLQLGVMKKTQKEYIEEISKCLEIRQLRDNYFDII